MDLIYSNALVTQIKLQAYAMLSLCSTVHTMIMYTYMHHDACIHSYVHTHILMHTYVHTYVHACIYTLLFSNCLLFAISGKMYNFSAVSTPTDLDWYLPLYIS